MRSSLIGDESAVTGSAGQAPWPSGCIKPGSCSRHATCMYAQSPKQCRHLGRDLTAEISAAQAPPSTPLPEEENRTRDDLREALAYLTPHPATKGPVILDPLKMRSAVSALQSENAALRAERDETLSRLSALQERVERAEKALADAMSSRGGAA